MSRSPTKFAHPCFFVLGYGRSGTTLFRRMLSAHPALYVAQENDAFQRLPPLIRKRVADAGAVDRLRADMPEYFSDIFDLDLFRREAVAHLPLSPADFIGLLQTTARIGQDKPDAQWGHKAPSEWPYLSTWRRWYPQARFLHVVRHPHDATASMNRHQLQRYRTTPLVATWQWRRAFRSIRRQAASLGPSRYLMVRYEDLVLDPAAALTSACRFLGVTTDPVPQMIDYTTDRSAAFVDGGAHMARTDAPLTPERIGRSDVSYSPRLTARLDHVVSRELPALGYHPRAAEPVSAAEASWLDASCLAMDAAWFGLRASRRAQGQL